MTKRLLIRAGSDYDKLDTVVPVNSDEAIIVESDVGQFGIQVEIKNFDGSHKHLSNSKYNVGDLKFLNGKGAGEGKCKVEGCSSDGNKGQAEEHEGDQETFEQPTNSNSSDKKSEDELRNLRIKISFKPKAQVRGSEFLFGNDILVPVRNYVPATLLSTALKFFTWFINPSVKGDVYADKPFLYGLALNSFNYIALRTGLNSVSAASDASKIWCNDIKHSRENLNENEDNDLEIPPIPAKRVKFFANPKHSESFVFNSSTTYFLQFESKFFKLMDSKYYVSLPTYGGRTFDIDALKYANDSLNNFNWVLKVGGYEGVSYGTLATVINFALEDE